VAPNSPAQWVGEHQQVVKAVAAPAAHKANATAALAKGLEARGAKPSTSKVTLHSYQYKQQVAPSIGGRMESPSATADVIQQFPAETGFLRSSASSAYSGQDVATAAWLTGLPAIIWVVVFATAVLFVQRCFGLAKCWRGAYEELPLAESSSSRASRLRPPSAPGNAGASVSGSGGGAAAPQSFYIGDSTSSRGSSPRPPQLSRCPSETEPEGEMFPSSRESTPRGRPRRPEDGGVVAAALSSSASASAPASAGASAAAAATPVRSSPHFLNVWMPSAASSEAPGTPPAAALIGRPLLGAIGSSSAAADASTAAAVAAPGKPSLGGGPRRGRVALLYASPLCHKDAAGRLVPIVQLPVEKEWSLLVQAYDESAAALREAHSGDAAGPPQPGVTLSARPLTAGSMQRSIAPVASAGAASVLHLSAHGLQDCLVMEDGRGTAHFCNCEMLQGMLELRESTPADCGVRLVVLNACRLRAVGVQFARGGIPHVVGCAVDLRETTSQVFLRALYGSLFQGSTVARAFSAALVALRSDPDAATRASAEHFYLLPEEPGVHNEVLFPPERPPLVGEAEQAPLTCAAPGAPQMLKMTGYVGRLSRHPSAATTAVGSAGEGSGSSMENLRELARDDSYSSDDPGVSSGTLSGGCCSREDTVSSSSDDEARASAGTARRALLDTSDVRQPRLPSRRQLALSKASAAARGAPAALAPAAPAAPARPRLGSSAFVSHVGPTLRRPVGLLQQSPFGRMLPPVPDDFLGRARDVWAVLQHLGTRRAVVVCGSHSKDHNTPFVQPGVGKSAVLDAVHRAFVVHMGGICISVQMRALSEADAVVSRGGWVEKLQSAVRLALQECQEQWWPCDSTGSSSRSTTMALAAPRSRAGGAGASTTTTSALPAGGVLRRRLQRRASGGVVCDNVSHGFHPLSDPIALRPAFEELVAEMGLLSEFAEMRQREYPAASGQVLLLLDECDHLIQQQHFQEAVADVLQRCPTYRVVLSTHQAMVGTAGGQFKVVHQPISGLPPEDAARLFLRRAQRPLRWEELSAAPGAALPLEAMAKVGARDPRAHVVMAAANEAEVLRLVAGHPSVAAQGGNPRRLIELASRLDPALPSLWALAPRSPAHEAAESTGSVDSEVDLR